MAVKTSVIPDLKDAIVDGLAARPAFSGVQVLTEPPGQDARLTHLWLQQETSNRVWYSTGGVLAETGTVAFEIVATSDDIGETGSRAARDAAYALLGDVDIFTVTDPTLGGLVLRTKVLTAEGEWGIPLDGAGRSHRITGTIEFEARLTPGG